MNKDFKVWLKKWTDLREVFSSLFVLLIFFTVITDLDLTMQSGAERLFVMIGLSFASYAFIYYIVYPALSKRLKK